MSETTPTLLADRALIRVAGDNPRDFLQGLVTQDVVGLDASAPRWGGLLTPQGKALFDFLLWAGGDAVLIDCEASVAGALTRRLSMYRLRRAITIEPATGAVHWSSIAGDSIRVSPNWASAGLATRLASPLTMHGARTVSCSG